MILGRIPYFGKDSNKIMKQINTSHVKEVIQTDLYSFVMNHLENDIVFVIKDYVYSWVSDIVFNYRDKECFIPYYDFDLYEETKRVNDNNGHLILNDKRQIRYNFELKHLDIKLNEEYYIYSIRQEKKFKIVFTGFYTGIFSVKNLYSLYLNACYKDDNYTVLKHESGYHYINKKTESYKNLEKIKRRKYKLLDYKDAYSYKDYRDVREYTYLEVAEQIGVFQNIELYKFRRLRFESYLYCNLREENVPVDYENWKKLGVDYNYIKYYDERKVLPLFIKSYWLNDNKIEKEIKRKTYDFFKVSL